MIVDRITKSRSMQLYPACSAAVLIDGRKGNTDFANPFVVKAALRDPFTELQQICDFFIIGKGLCCLDDTVIAYDEPVTVGEKVGRYIDL
tara:strand:+ start:136 stop:405 length:270 start_codon:yes stop_codon:yes gene_type:complete